MHTTAVAGQALRYRLFIMLVSSIRGWFERAFGGHLQAAFVSFFALRTAFLFLPSLLLPSLRHLRRIHLSLYDLDHLF
jgi:hypothetical protein